jgi:hypothetical protein
VDVIRSGHGLRNLGEGIGSDNKSYRGQTVTFLLPTKRRAGHSDRCQPIGNQQTNRMRGPKVAFDLCRTSDITLRREGRPGCEARAFSATRFE